MRSLLLATAIVAFTGTAYAQADAHSARPEAKLAPRAQDSTSDPGWGPAPPALPPGAQIAVLQGNPGASGVYTLRLRMPDGYTIPPHFHPTDELVTVISGNLLLGHGDDIEQNRMTGLHAGGFIALPAGMHHYARARGQTVVQVHGEGPFAITYVHPGDDPRKPSKR